MNILTINDTAGIDYWNNFKTGDTGRNAGAYPFSNNKTHRLEACATDNYSTHNRQGAGATCYPGVKNIILKGILLVFLLLLTILSPTPAFCKAIKGGKQVFKLDYKIIYTNNTKKNLNLKLTIPIVDNYEPHQKVLSSKIFPDSAKISKTADGKFATFSFNKIPPGKQVKFGYNARILTHRIFYDIKADKVNSKYPKQVIPYIKPTTIYPANAKLVKQILEKIISGESNTYYRLLKCYDYVRNLKFELTRGAVPVTKVLKTGICQCSDATEVFITFSRSLGVPARYCGGIYLKESLGSVNDTHAWAEIYLPPYGWLPVDPTMARFAEVTRLSRFCEIDSPYIFLWRNKVNPFSIQVEDVKKNVSKKDFKLNVTYKVEKKRSGVSLKKIYPNLSLNFKNSPRPNILSKNPKAKQAFIKANNLFKKGKLNEAEKHLREAIKIDPGFTVAYRRLVSVYEKKKKLPALKKELLKSLSDKANKGSAHYAVGVIEMQQGHYSKALQRFRDAKKSGVPGFITDYNIGALYKKGKQIPGSVKYFQLSLQQNPWGVQSYSELIELLEYLEDFNTMAELCNSAIKLMPIGGFYHQLAKAYMGTEQYKKALDAGNKAVQKEPGNGNYYGTLGRIYLRSGNLKKGREYINHAIKEGVSEADKAFLKNILKRAETELKK